MRIDTKKFRLQFFKEAAIADTHQEQEKSPPPPISEEGAKLWTLQILDLPDPGPQK